MPDQFLMRPVTAACFALGFVLLGLALGYWARRRRRETCCKPCRYDHGND